MTMPYGSTEEPTVTEIMHQSVPIHVVSSSLKPGKPIGTEFGRTRTLVVANVVGPNSVTPGAQRVLNRSLRRYEARIEVIASIAAQVVTDGAIFGSREEIMAGGQLGAPGAVIGQVGGFLPCGKSLVFKSQAELWVCYPLSNAATVYVTVTDFQWASDPGSFEEEGIG
jgi:hypothetical protein